MSKKIPVIENDLTFDETKVPPLPALADAKHRNAGNSHYGPEYRNYKA
jgi:hypothetical protein